MPRTNAIVGNVQAPHSGNRIGRSVIGAAMANCAMSQIAGVPVGVIITTGVETIIGMACATSVPNVRVCLTNVRVGVDSRLAGIDSINSTVYSGVLSTLADTPSGVANVGIALSIRACKE